MLYSLKLAGSLSKQPLCMYMRIQERRILFYETLQRNSWTNGVLHQSTEH